MAYSFPKFSFLIGVALIGLIVFQFKTTGKLHYVNDDEEVKKTFWKNVETTMCDGQVRSQVVALVAAMIPNFNAQIALVALMACVILTFTFSLLPQRGCFMWMFVRLVTIVFIAVGILCGYYIYASQSAECKLIKNILTEERPSIDFEAVKKNPYVQKVLAMVSEKIIVGAQKFLEVFKANVQKLGITQPAFVVVIAFYLMNKVTAGITKKQVIFLVSLIVSVISGIEFYAQEKDIILAIALPALVVVLSIIVFNVIINCGYLFAAPAFFYSCLMITTRIMTLIGMFVALPEITLVTVAVFAFFFANVYVWTSNGAFLTIIFMLNFGLSTLYPLPTESLIIGVFLLFIFTKGETKKNTVQAADKVKTD